MAIDKKILSIDEDEDDSIDYNSFNAFLHDDTKRKMAKNVKEITVIGEDLLKEISEKKARQNIDKAKYVKYIMKHNKGIYTAERLMSYEFADIFHIYTELKDSKQSKLITFFKFFFNL
jgi:hypothetical protein